jgi:hypothetical protein
MDSFYSLTAETAQG